MSEAAAAAAPATTAAPAPTQAPPAVAAEKTEARPAESKQAAWDAAREAQLLELLKSSPYGKLKANGKEEVLDSPEKLKALLLDAARGKGASKMTEEAKREKAEAAKAKEEAALLRKALQGDAAARKALGIIDPAEAQAKEAALAEVPPEVRAMYEELEAVKAENARLAQEREAIQRAEQERREAAYKEQVRSEALGFAKSLVESLGTGDEAEALLPYTLRAMHDLGEEGLRMGVDVTPEQVQTLARQLFEADGVGRVEKLSPKSFLGAALKRLEAMPVKEVVAGLSPKMRVAMARELAQLRVAAKTKEAAAPKPAEPPSSLPTTSTLPKPLSPFKWGR